MTELVGMPPGCGTHPEGDRTPSLVKNTGFNIAAALLGLGVGLVLSPVLLATLGLERFGLWSLLWAIAGSLGMVDLRLAAALTPLVAAAWARQERERVARQVGAAFLFYIAMGLVEVGVAVAGVRLPSLVAWIPEGLREEARFALVAAVVVFALTTVATVFDAVLQGLQRFDLSSRIAMVVMVARGIVLVLVALGGGGLRALLLAEMTVAGAQCLLTARAVRRLLPDLRLLRAPHGGTLRELAAFGGKLQIAHAGHLVTLHADKFLLSSFLGLSAVAYYELGQKVAYVMRGLPLLLISATMPVVSTMETRGDRERLWHFHLACMRVVVFAATPLLVFTLTGAGHILRAWADVGALEARQAVWLLALGYYLYLLNVTGSVTSVGMRKPELEMRRCVLVGALNLAGSAILIPVVGFLGAPLGTALSLGVGAGYLIRALSAEFRQPAWSLLSVVRQPAILALPAAAGALLVLWMVDGSRGMAVLALGGSAAVIGAAFVWLGLRHGIFPREWLGGFTVRLRPPAARP